MPEHRMKTLVFPCGAYFPLNRDWPVDGAHYAKDGSIRLNVYPSTSPMLTAEVLEKVKKRSGIDYDGTTAPCRFFCPVPKRRKEERGWLAGAEQISTFVSCFARLHVDGADVTPPAPDRCPHCEEQRTYIAAIQAAVKNKLEPPEREAWRKCPQCGRHAEVTADTGLCRSCQGVL